MEATKKYSRHTDYAASLFAGILFVFAAITIFGYGAAVAIPKSILEPLTSTFPSFAFSIVDIVTLGIPAAIVFVSFAWVIALLKFKVFYTLILLPFMLFILFSTTDLLVNTETPIFYLASSLAKILPVVVCAFVLAKRDRVSSDV